MRQRPGKTRFKNPSEPESQSQSMAMRQSRKGFDYMKERQQPLRRRAPEQQHPVKTERPTKHQYLRAFNRNNPQELELLKNNLISHRTLESAEMAPKTVKHEAKTFDNAKTTAQLKEKLS